MTSLCVARPTCITRLLALALLAAPVFATPVPEDINGDGTVNAADVWLFRTAWQVFKGGGALDPAADFNDDSAIDTEDSRRLMEYVLFCEQHGPYTTMLSTQMIGPEGGTLAATGFRLIVPAGAFDGNHRLRLYRAPNPTSRDPGSVSPTFRVEGLPSLIYRALTMKLRMAEGATLSGYSFIGMGEPVFVRGDAGMTTRSMALDGTAEAGWLVATVPKSTEPIAPDSVGSVTPAQTAAVSGVTASAFSGYRRRSTTHFRATYHRASCSDAAAAIVLNSCETGWSLIESLYELSWARRTRRPVDVYIRNIPVEGDVTTLAQCVPSAWGVNYWYVETNSNFTGDNESAQRMSPAVQHEVFHLIQGLYDPRNRVASSAYMSPWYWFEEATAVGFEYTRGIELVPAGSPLPVPDTLTAGPGGGEGNYAFCARHALEFPAGARTQVVNHGYGAGMWAHYLLQTRGYSGIGDLFEAHYGNASLGASEALANVLGTSADLAIQFEFFADRWMLGNLFAGQRFPTGPQVLGLLRTDDRVRFNGATIGKTLTYAFPDLSIWPILIKREDNYPATASVCVSVTGLDNANWQPLVYSYANGTFTNTTSAKPLIINNFGAGASSYLLALVNTSARRPYTASTNTTVGVQLSPHITSVTPESGAPGTTVRIEGGGWGQQPASGVGFAGTFGAVPTAVQSWGAREIVVTVPQPLNDDYGPHMLGVYCPGPAQPTWGVLTASKEFNITRRLPLWEVSSCNTGSYG